jgi:hypothetical protein
MPRSTTAVAIAAAAGAAADAAAAVVQAAGTSAVVPAALLDVGSPPDAIVWICDAEPALILYPPELDGDENALLCYSFEFEPERKPAGELTLAAGQISVSAGRAEIAATVEAARALAVAFTCGDARAAVEIAAVACSAMNAAPVPALVGGARRAAAVSAARRALAAFASASAALSAWGAPPADQVAALRSFVADLRAGVRKALRQPPGGDQPAAAPPPDFACQLRSQADAVARCMSPQSGEIDRVVTGCALFDLHALLITVESLIY